jgi:hypothetical protein
MIIRWLETAERIGAEHPYCKTILYRFSTSYCCEAMLERKASPHPWRGAEGRKRAKQQGVSCTSKDHNIQDGASGQGHEPGEDEREPLIIIVRSTDSIAFTFQDITHTIPQACIPIEQQYPRHGRLLCTWTRHIGKSICEIKIIYYYYF